MPGLGRAISDTRSGEKVREILRCGVGRRGIMPKPFETKLRPVMSVIE